MDITYAPAAGLPVVIQGIFDSNYLLATGDAEAGVEVRAPAVFLHKADLPADPEYDDPTLTIGAVDYVVVERKPDSLSGIVLVLKRAP